MGEWSLEDIERQAARGGVNRQQAQQLVDEIRRLRDGIETHRKAYAGMAVTIADRVLWSVLKEPS